MRRNRPGLSDISYRLGTYASFRAALLARIQAPDGLPGLTWRDDDDFSITLLDLWAAVADILSFYQERYANESFVRTATLPASVADLVALAVPQGAAGTAGAGAIGPGAAGPGLAGVAASADLLLTVDTGAVVEVAQGLKVQSVPGPEEEPQIFEVLEPAVADWRFNELRVYPGSVDVNAFKPGATEALVASGAGPELSAQLKPGDQILLLGGDGSTGPVEEKKVDKLTVSEDRVTLAWKNAVQQAGHSSAYQFKRTFKLFGSSAPTVFASPGNLSKPVPVERVNWTLTQLVDFSYPQTPEEKGPVDFLGDPVPVEGQPVARLCLDATYQGLEPGQLLLVADLHEDPAQTPPVAGTKTVVRIVRVDQVEDTFGPLPARVTRVWVVKAGSGLPPAAPDRRQVLVYELVGKPIQFARFARPLSAAAWTNTVELPGRQAVGADRLPIPHSIEVGLAISKGDFKPGLVIATSDLEVGRKLVLSDGNRLAEVAHVKAPPSIVPDPDDPTGAMCVLRLQLDVVPRVAPESAVARGNLALAGHGQTVPQEVLGSADGTVPFQTFTLKRKPLTFVLTPNGGATGTLQVFVDGVPWTEVPRLGNQPPSARVYTTTIAPDGSVTVRFGDGKNGKIPPTGRGNVTARYRYGSGAAGNVRAGILTTLLDRPTGLLVVTNPFPATGGSDGGSAEAIRQAAGRAVRTFGRAVTLHDIEEVALTAGGAAKAQASPIFAGLNRTLVVTVAGPRGEELPAGGARMASALGAVHDPALALRILPYQGVSVVLGARVTLDSRRPAADLLRAARQSVLDAFSFDALALGQSLFPADLHAALEGVPGVTGAQLLAFDVKPRGGQPPQVQSQITVSRARLAADGTILPAQLAVVEAPKQDVTIVARGAVRG